MNNESTAADITVDTVDTVDIGEVVVPEDPDDPTLVGEIPDRRVLAVAAVLFAVCAGFIAYGFLGAGLR
ncbi:hypothetical protein [Streptomyces sp. NPDC018059]|uniref:hypothetical protein n=1 Tax=Streptomyces sp. NPDC018059 TaxID=3365041 RepID=UPI0037AACAD9